MHHRTWTEPRQFKDEDFSLAQQFATRLHEEAKGLVKEIIFFGSANRKDSLFEEMYSHDIDVLVIFDDGVFIINPELIETYRVISTNIAMSVSRRLHINTIKLSAFWEYAIHGDPIIVNILREGVPLVNAGIFETLQNLLDKKMIPPSKECLWAYYMRSPETLRSAKWHLLQATTDLYWAVMNAAHAALISISIVPNTPEHAISLVKEHFVKPSLMHKSHFLTIGKLWKIEKQIAEQKFTLTGYDYDILFKEAKEVVIALQSLCKNTM